MASLNRKVRQYTHEGAPAKIVDAVSQLERSVMSCMLWEDGFYETGIEIAKRIKDLCAVIDPMEVARIAVQAKQDMRLRHVPLLLAREMVRTKDGRAALKNVIPHVITRADDLTEFMALYWADGKVPLAKQLKRLLGESFRKFDEYQLQKYNGGKKSVKLADVLKLTRPKPVDDAQAALWQRLVKNELATPDTWEVELSKSTDKKASWNRLIIANKLGGLALLRNLRNIRTAGVDDVLTLGAIASLNAGRLLPINFIAAANHNPSFEPALEKKFFDCFANRVQQSGRTVILVDVSGSMDEKLSGRGEMTRMDVACSLAMLGRELFADLRVLTFSDTLVEVPARRGFALRDAITQSQIHNGTNLGGAVLGVMQSLSPERLIVITDEQSRTVVPDVKGGYMVNVASNKNGVGYGPWLHIDGWSDKVLDYIIHYENNRQR